MHLSAALELFSVTALLLVALTFYSTLTLGSDTYGTPATKSAAYAVLCVLVTPFGCFLWWLTLGRLLAHKQHPNNIHLLLFDLHPVHLRATASSPPELVESNSILPEADDADAPAPVHPTTATSPDWDNVSSKV
eukprot:1150748-Pelagomonas_calceolata.AAC.5